MASEKKRGSWLGHPLLAPEHEHDLHLAAALNEFERGMPRHEAEHAALEDYRREHHARAAAHHYAGMKAGHSTGNMEDAKKHHALYALHVKALGEDPMGPVPEVVRKYHQGAGTEKQPHAYRFHGHDADEYLVQPVTKSELELCDLKKAASPQQVVEALRAASARVAGWCDLSGYFDELAKGDVVDLRLRQTIAPVQRQAPEWVPNGKTCDNENCPGGNDRYAAEAAPGYSLCPDCINTLRRAEGKPPYDPQEHVKRGYASPEEMMRARVGDVFEQGAQLFAQDQAAKPKPRPHLTVVKKEDPVKEAARKVGESLKAITLAAKAIDLLKK